MVEFNARRWLWTWSGRCFGYRRGNALYRYDGIQVGRFVEQEIYGIDGAYLGEVRAAEDGERLITSIYKRCRTASPCVPGIDRALPRPEDRRAYPVYCGHEDFPEPDSVKAVRSHAKPRRQSCADTIQ